MPVRVGLALAPRQTGVGPGSLYDDAASGLRSDYVAAEPSAAGAADAQAHPDHGTPGSVRSLSSLGSLNSLSSLTSGASRELLAAKRAKGKAVGRKPTPLSRYVSVGRVRPFTGDVGPAPALVLALESRSVHREVILITDTRPRSALQLADNLLQLGFAHTLWLTSGHSACSAAERLRAGRDALRAARSGGSSSSGSGSGSGSGSSSEGSDRSSSSSDGGSEGGEAAAAAAAALRRLAAAATGASSAAAAAASSSSGALPPLNHTALMLRMLEAAALEDGSPAPFAAAAPAAAGAADALACAWYAQPFPAGFTGHRRLMMKRVMLMARAVRLGYNVLSLDTDVVVLRDPYPHLKAPPYGAMHMVVGRSVRGGGVVNTGVMYVQNASRHGPISWLLAEVVDRNLRWVEHNVSMPHMAAAAAAAAASASAVAAAASGGAGAVAAGGGGGGGGAVRLMPHQADSRGCWDQFLFGDVVLTGMTGKVVLLYCARPNTRPSGGAKGALAGLAAAAAARRGGGGGGAAEEGGSSWADKHRVAMGLADNDGPTDLMVHEVTVSDQAHAALVAARTYTTTWVNISVPRAATPLLPAEPGYSLPGLKQGFSADAFQKQLAADAKHLELRRRLRRLGRRLARRRRRGRRLLEEEEGMEHEEEEEDQEEGAGLEKTAEEGEEGDSGSLGQGRRLMAADGAGGEAAAAAAAAALPPERRAMERLAYAADWLIGGWPQRGALGLWDPLLTSGKQRQVFAHLVRAPGPTSVGKDAVRMQYGEYDWELAALAGGGPFPFLGSPDPAEPPRLVALLPEVDTACDSHTAWTNTARGLVQVALLTGRRLVWPSIPCADSGPWVSPNPGSRRSLPLNVNLKFLAHGVGFGTKDGRGPGGGGLQCTPALIFHHKCLYERHVVIRNDSVTAAAAAAGTLGAAGGSGAASGMDGGDGEAGPEYDVRVEGPRALLPAEFQLYRRLLPGREGEPGPHNTVHLQGDDGEYEDGEKPIMFDEPPRAAGVVYIKAAAVAKALREGPLAAQRVLYLAQRTFLTQLDKLGEPGLMTAYRTFRHECPALK
ncbi:hypothetical protein HYH02_014676 [Chlamydomonas schloesseri]|uniref:Nucleotide-diphospho-sugar transferase domain-containing protein n=1 Tax=Chlamydomonas schloesseri TaxID=2026947 RepID=A0A835VTA3_9CHLO|nr:hypothetical protein HYH02_014676 [Chlamydomonas schloesseri]|eukprot:KAG2427030.1 hypothetical protein HYH02_014676 [Chlamydomonas schloesseri]